MRTLLALGLFSVVSVVAVACSDVVGVDSEFTAPANEPTPEEPPPPPFATDATPDGPGEAGIDCDANPTACPPPSVCGDGKAGLGESCDDKNTVDGDGCSSTCQIEAPYWACAFGSKCVDVRDCDALIDAGLAGDAGCTPPPKTPVCGDGFIDPGEACDDGNVANNDG